MKQKITKIAIFMSALLALGGCRGNMADGFVSNVELEGYEYDVIGELPDSLAMPETVEGGRYVRLSGLGVLPRNIGRLVHESVRDSLLKLGGIADVDRSGAQPRVQEGIRLTDLDPKTTAACSSSSRTLTVALVTPRLIVWRAYAYAYLGGGAHGMYSTRFLNYSITKGKILGLDDLFKEGFETELAGMIREKLQEEEVQLSVDLQDVNVSPIFEITPTGLRFLYPLYEIAPYYEGEVTVEIPTYELEDLLRPGVEEMLSGVTAD
ncbi:MAG: RsiV family protein [Muribaculaceae bacterium]|nr:RsiV family protein [Muribaculaceae bacterium]